MIKKWTQPPNPFAAKIRVVPDPHEAAPTMPPPLAAPVPVREPAISDMKAMRAPIVPVKKARKVHRLPGQKLLKRIARIQSAIDQARAEVPDVGGELDDATVVNLHGAIGDIIERMQGRG